MGRNSRFDVSAICMAESWVESICRGLSNDVGQHSYNTLDSGNINAVDFGAAFLPSNQDPTLAANAGTLFKGNFVWDLPDVPAAGARTRALGLLVNDWQLSGVWTGDTGTAPREPASRGQE